jgi:hypothetical protein
MLGRWEQALESADAFIAECEGSPHTQEMIVREVRWALFLGRGNRERAVSDQLRGQELAEARHDPFNLLGACALTASAYMELGRPDEARAYAVRVPPLVREYGLHGGLTRLAVFADELGIGDDLREAVDAKAGPTFPFWRDVIEHILSGELEVAAGIMGSARNLTIEAYLRKHAGLRLLAAGSVADAEVQLGRALAFYRSVGASAYVSEIDSALADVQSASA